MSPETLRDQIKDKMDMLIDLYAKPATFEEINQLLGGAIPVWVEEESVHLNLITSTVYQNQLAYVFSEAIKLAILSDMFKPESHAALPTKIIRERMEAFDKIYQELISNLDSSTIKEGRGTIE